MEVKPIGEAVFELAGQTYRIAANELKQQIPKKNSSGILKDDADDWSVSFTASNALGEFVWLVSYSLGIAGASLDIDELVEQPAGLEMRSNMGFELIEDEE